MKMAFIINYKLDVYWTFTYMNLDNEWAWEIFFITTCYL